MKKTTTVNLGGRVFNIDEDAYSALQQYLKAIERKLIHDPDANEIIQDIELRMAELLHQQMNSGRQVVIKSDVEYLKSILGRAEDFSDEQGSSKGATYHNRKRARRIYRDPENEVLGGVCGGLGAYFNVDPLWFRVLFIVVLLLGGSGLLIYLVMWIIIPPARTTAQKLEMRGEAVTIENIKRAFREEFENVKSKMRW